MKRDWLRKATTNPPTWTARRLLSKIGDELISRKYRLDAMIQGTYANDFPGDEQDLNRFVDPVPVDLLRPHTDEIVWLTDRYLEHRFDLLGSGWTTVEHGTTPRGIEGITFDPGAPITTDRSGAWLEDRLPRGVVNEAQERFGPVDTDYTSIDWHLDFKSGFRWAEDTWSQNIEYGHRPGVDVKLPWELSRCQHLPHLVWAYALADAGRDEFKQPERYVQEFRNQVRDFTASNPPGFGVNWSCTMDVAIRAANVGLTYDLFRAYGIEFDPSFRDLVARVLYEHGRHVVTHLEWDPERRANHYLANVAGLLFVASFLPSAPETDAWLGFASKSLIAEVKEQFHADGGNFEGSTCYHRLSAEMVVYATAIALGVPADRWEDVPENPADSDELSLRLSLERNLDEVARPPPFPSWYRERIARMGAFTDRLTAPTNRVPQIGDNDSGRFLKLAPNYSETTVRAACKQYHELIDYEEIPTDATYFIENSLDHSHLTDAIEGLFNGPSDGIDAHVIGSLSTDGFRSKPSIELDRTTGNPGAVDRFWRRGGDQPSTAMATYTFDVDFSDAMWYAFDEFGVYVFATADAHLVVRCGSVGQRGNGGHDHDDQLSLTLWANGRPLIGDPGSYLYTPLPERRNEYRSANAHFCPRLADESDHTTSDLFSLEISPGECLGFGPEGFVGHTTRDGVDVYRVIRLGDIVEIRDFTTEGVRIAPVPLDSEETTAFRRLWPRDLLYSPRYGSQERFFGQE